jgi:cupin 2 domain-containing protein
VNNLYQDIPEALPAERVDVLARATGVVIERIVSRGHASPDSGWYDQSRAEFVVLLSGAARLEFEDGERLTLGPGDWLDIPMHRRHRVAWTDPDADSVWLAVHYDPADAT